MKNAQRKPRPMKTSLCHRLRNHRGFTLFEMILTVAVLAILISITTPAIYNYMSQKDREEENTRLNEVQKAMGAYLADKGTLPDDALDGSVPFWYDELAGYSKLTAAEIQKDVWGRDHRYTMRGIDRPIYTDSINVTYAVVLSAGENGKAEPSTGIDVSADGKFTWPGAQNPKWWKNASANPPTYTTDDDARIGKFSKLAPAGDDMLVRYTNYTEMMDRYKVTMERMDKISQALETYAKAGYAQKISWCNDPAYPNRPTNNANCAENAPEKMIYYPCSIATSVSGDCSVTKTGASAVYLYQPVDASTGQPATIVDNGGTDGARYNDMIALMKLLGLPSEYCCSALITTKNNNGKSIPMPFYYFSNPRQRNSYNDCADRKGFDDATTDNPKLPARITVDNISKAAGTQKNPATCG